MCITFILYFFFEIKSIFLLLSCVSRFLFEDKVLLLLRPDESSTQTRSKRCPKYNQLKSPKTGFYACFRGLEKAGFEKKPVLGDLKY